jgi:hypothetical protein
MIAVIIGPSVNIRIVVNNRDPNICIEVRSILQRGPYFETWLYPGTPQRFLRLGGAAAALPDFPRR